MGNLTTILVVGTLFVGFPWVILHYVTKWKTAAKITNEDEKLLDELYNLARRLEERLVTVERITSLDHPEYRLGGAAAPAPELSYRSEATYTKGN